MPLVPPRHGLRVTVRYNGLVVDQTVHWGRDAHLLGGSAPDPVPTEGEGPLANLRWLGPDSARVDAMDKTALPGQVSPDQGWRWSNQQGVDVDVDVVRMQRAPRWSGQAGDIALLALVLMLTVGVGQLGLLARLFGGQAQGGEAVGMEPTPELIGRLLRQDLDGAEEGLPEKVQAPEQQKEAPSFYMPAGNEGPSTRPGGGAVAGPTVVRAEPVPDEEPAEEPAELPTTEAPTPQGVSDTLAELEAAGLEDAASAEQPPETSRGPLVPPATPMERFVGWGFRDWFDVKDSRASTVEDGMRRDLDLARQRLKIDPNDPGAINLLGYYAYLAENWSMTEAAFQKLIELYPEDAAGYNNLALVYKRTGEYVREEGLYRKALELDPLDSNVLNNLAVCLAHQGRFDEALEIMALLEDLDPGDSYADLHRAKIYAAMGKKLKSYEYLDRALDASADMDTMHHIEFRQDIRVDPAFDAMRGEPRFQKVLYDHYGPDAAELLRGRDGKAPEHRWRRRRG